jgi:solute carrier family 25 carnitine/acylcarnitine transporter 20/29
VGTGIFWGSYEGVKQLLSVSRGGEPDNPIAGGVAGGLCGMLAFLSVSSISELKPRNDVADNSKAYPIDTVKTVYQRNCLFLKDGKNQVVPINWFGKEQYRGLPITMARVFLSNLIQMWIYEYMKKKIRNMEVDPPLPPRHGQGQE